MEGPDGSWLWYTGEGGNDLLSSRRQVASQKMKGGNQALANSHALGLPVRLARFIGKSEVDSYTGRKYIYDGLYHVETVKQERGTQGMGVVKFLLVRQQSATNGLLRAGAVAPRHDRLLTLGARDGSTERYEKDAKRQRLEATRLLQREQPAQRTTTAVVEPAPMPGASSCKRHAQCERLSGHRQPCSKVPRTSPIPRGGAKLQQGQRTTLDSMLPAHAERAGVLGACDQRSSSPSSIAPAPPMPPPPPPPPHPQNRARTGGSGRRDRVFEVKPPDDMVSCVATDFQQARNSERGRTSDNALSGYAKMFPRVCVVFKQKFPEWDGRNALDIVDNASLKAALLATKGSESAIYGNNSNGAGTPSAALLWFRKVSTQYDEFVVSSLADGVIQLSFIRNGQRYTWAARWRVPPPLPPAAAQPAIEDMTAPAIPANLPFERTVSSDWWESQQQATNGKFARMASDDTAPWPTIGEAKAATKAKRARAKARKAERDHQASHKPASLTDRETEDTVLELPGTASVVHAGEWASAAMATTALEQQPQRSDCKSLQRSLTQVGGGSSTTATAEQLGEAIEYRRPGLQPTKLLPLFSQQAEGQDCVPVGNEEEDGADTTSRRSQRHVAQLAPTPLGQSKVPVSDPSCAAGTDGNAAAQRPSQHQKRQWMHHAKPDFSKLARPELEGLCGYLGIALCSSTCSEELGSRVARKLFTLESLLA